MLRYETIGARQLTPGQTDEWRGLMGANPLLASPFFHPAYTQAVASVRDGVEVCLIRDRESLVGVYSFERVDRFVGRPVGGGMSNFQGVVAAPGTPWSAQRLARAAGLTTLRFHHQLVSQPEFGRYVEKTEGSPYLALAAGWDEYLAERGRAGVNSFNALPRKTRRLINEVGPLRFVAHDTAGEPFDQLLAWKLAQYVRTERRGSLQEQWAVDALKLMLARQGEGFWGMLSCLYAGDRLAAVHLGIRSATEWHYWYPTYDPELGRYSPGLILLHEMARWSCEMGITQINLGKGAADYKNWFGSADVPVAVGKVVVPRLVNLFSRLTRKLGKPFRRSPAA